MKNLPRILQILLCTVCIQLVTGFFFTRPASGNPQISMAAGSGSSPPLTTHILDTAKGLPAPGVSMKLSMLNQSGEWQEVETGVTNSDGRGGFFGSTGRDKWTAGTYKLYFDTGSYFASLGTKGFYPYVEVVFRIDEPEKHYHVPLLLSPYSYSTYRGS